MATKAPASTTKHKKTNSPKTVATTTSTTRVSRSQSSVWQRFSVNFNREVSARALLTELGGTFVLTSIVLFSGDAFFTGLTLFVLAIGALAISGAHMNPAVTFALWVTRSLPGIRVPFFWIAQFVGAMAALLAMHMFAGTALSLSLSSFMSFEPKIFFAELIGALVFVYGVSAALGRTSNTVARAAGIGFSLTVGIVLATGLLSSAVTALNSGGAANATDLSESRLAKVSNVTLNPAVAIALTEKGTQSATSVGAQPEASNVSRLTLETILGPLTGGAIGAALFRLIGRNQD